MRLFYIIAKERKNKINLLTQYVVCVFCQYTIYCVKLLYKIRILYKIRK